MTKRILIVEDDNAMARLLSDNLKYEGFLVETCDSGRKPASRLSRNSAVESSEVYALPATPASRSCAESGSPPAAIARALASARRAASASVRPRRLNTVSTRPDVRTQPAPSSRES